MSSTTQKMSPSAEIRHNVKPSHHTTPRTVVGAPVNLAAFAGVLAVCVLPVAGVLADPRSRELVRTVWPKF
ncbi:hypothetical protein GCM10027047_29250 [Rhodococcus aerolatus]